MEERIDEGLSHDSWWAAPCVMLNEVKDLAQPKHLGNTKGEILRYAQNDIMVVSGYFFNARLQSASCKIK